MLLGRGHLTKGAAIAARYEDRIIAEASVAARWPHKLTLDPPLEHLDLSLRRGEGQGTDELRATIGRASQFAFDTAHRQSEVLIRTSPARGVDPRLSPQGSYTQ